VTRRTPVNEPLDTACILVVDDDAATREFVSGLLRQKGYRVFATASGAEMLSAVSVRHPDLILLDVMLPDADGLSLCRRLKQDAGSRDIPVVFLTAMSDGRQMLDGFEAGGVDYIVKPFDVSVLLARVQTHSTLSRLSRGLQRSLDERTAGLAQANRRLRELNVEMALLEERQRRRLAQQLHDTTIQQLVLARIIIEGEDGGLGRKDRLVTLLDDSLRQLRSLVFELSPPILSQAGLHGAAEWLAEWLAEQWGLSVDCELQGEPMALPDAIALTLFQGLRELLINVAKHAEVGHAHVCLRFAPEWVEVLVDDDGRGFPDTGPIAGGFGLSSLRSRIELLGGCVEIGARKPKGTRVRLHVPLNASGGCTEAAQRPIDEL
jgi:two-component system, sensor histidine kinase and response regulator